MRSLNVNNKNQLIQEYILKDLNRQIIGYIPFFLSKQLQKFEYTDFKLLEIYEILKNHREIKFPFAFSCFGPDIWPEKYTRYLSIEEYKRMIEYYLNFVGFNQIIKDYTIVIFLGKEDPLPEHVAQGASSRTTFVNSFEVLFDDSKLSKQEEENSKNNFFNGYYFNEKVIVESLFNRKKYNLLYNLSGEVGFEFSKFSEDFLPYLLNIVVLKGIECLEKANKDDLVKKFLSGIKIKESKLGLDLKLNIYEDKESENCQKMDGIFKVWSNTTWYRFPESVMYKLDTTYAIEFGIFNYGKHKEYFDNLGN